LARVEFDYPSNKQKIAAALRDFDPANVGSGSNSVEAGTMIKLDFWSPAPSRADIQSLNPSWDARPRA